MQDENGFYHMKPNHIDDIHAKGEGTESEGAAPFGFSGGEGGASYVEYGPERAYYAPNPPKKKGSVGIIALIVAACVLFSAIACVGGVLIGRGIYGGGSTPQGGGSVGGTGGASESVVINTLPKDTVIANGSYASVGAACASGVVEIRTAPVESGIGNTIAGAAGSGVVIGLGKTTQFPYIVTNNHVVEGYSSITVLSHSGESYEAKLIGTDWMSDIAVLVVEDSTTTLSPVACGDSTKIVLGEEVVAIGNPLGALGGSLTEGVISSVSRTISIENIPMTLLQTSAAINPGNSGGGLFDMDGRLIGIVNAKITGSAVDGIGFAIPINTALERVNELLAKGYVAGVPDLGFTFVDSDSTAIYSYRYNDEIADAGKQIKTNDILQSINGVLIEEYSDYRGVLASLLQKDGSMPATVTAVILRPVSSGIFTKYTKITVELRVHEYIPEGNAADEDVNIEGGGEEGQ
ncbi:MAG: trypsin-like peptidase domain-containing protein [Clostridia bacterium]|nr:trypsin-like peptidase domain-containing protein [Clostridia bacterium]